MKHADELEDKERTDLEAVLKVSPAADRIYQLYQRFLELFDQKSSAGFDEWLEDVGQSEFAKLCNFASGLRRDYQAVKAAFDSEWSNGQVEGQVIFTAFTWSRND
jgi:transposase